MSGQMLLHEVWQSNSGVFGLELGPDVLLEPLDCLGIVCKRRSFQSLTRGLNGHISNQTVAVLAGFGHCARGEPVRRLSDD
jgi:hypothetical protein